MARRRLKENGQHRMLSLWEPPAHAGSPVGVLATTFTLNAALFEEECLARFAGVQSDPTRDGALYRIEREEKLANLLCAAVVADIHHCRGQRSLRWDLLASRPASGVMHAKVSLLVWSEHVRVVISSANLTNEGYRRNQECAAVLDFANRTADRRLLDPLLVFLRGILATTTGASRLRAERLVDEVDRSLSNIPTTSRGLQRRLILTGPGRRDIFHQLNEHLPASRPESADVVSPFFDEEFRETGPEVQLWAMLRQRGEARMRLHVAGDFFSELGQWRLQVPEHVLQSTPGTRSGAVLSLHPVGTSSVPTDSGPERRPLHAKMLTLSHPGWVAWLVGSSNFTSAGLGLSKYRRNFEANVLYFVRADASNPLYRSIESGGLRGESAVDPGAKVQFEPPRDREDGEGAGLPPLPAFFLDADLLTSTDEHHELTLNFERSTAPPTWWIRRDSVVIYHREAWLADGAPEAVRIEVPRTGPPPSVFTVEWTDAQTVRQVADWPVNVRDASALPPPAELRGLTLAALLELLSSAQPLHDAMRSWLRRQPDDDDPDGPHGPELVDPHRKVDTSGFLINRVQRACSALRHLRERLTQPVLSDAALVWRLDGPVGARAVIDAIERQCDPALPDEWAFLLCELVGELKGVRLKDNSGRRVESALQSRFEEFLEEQRIRKKIALQTASDALRTYAQLSEVRRETT